MRLELTRSCDHYPLKVACIPISPPARQKQPKTIKKITLSVPETGLEPARLSTLAPETSASTNSAIRALPYSIITMGKQGFRVKKQEPRPAFPLSGKRDSNSRPRPWQGRALPTELLPQI